MLKTPVLYVLLLLVMLGFFVIKINTLPPQIPLYYSRPGSDLQIVQVYYVFLIPLISLIFIGLNSIIAARVLKDHFVKTIAHFQNIFIIVVMFYIFVRIIALVS